MREMVCKPPERGSAGHAWPRGRVERGACVGVGGRLGRPAGGSPRNRVSACALFTCIVFPASEQTALCEVHIVTPHATPCQNTGEGGGPAAGEERALGPRARPWCGDPAPPSGLCAAVLACQGSRVGILKGVSGTRLLLSRWHLS